MAYSTAASASIPDPKWMAMHFTVDPGVSPTLTAFDIGLLLFHKLEFPRNGVNLQIDPSAYKVLKIKIPGDYDYSKHLSASGIVLRKGLTVLPMMEARKDKWVRITRLPPEVDNFQVEQVLRLFGKQLSPVRFIPLEVKKSETQDEYAKLVSMIPSTDRSVNMIIEQHIPSFISIDGKKVKL